MKIEISPHHAKALEAAVAAGTFPSIDEAVSAALDQLLVAEMDLSWAKPLVDVALAERARGEGIPISELLSKLDRRMSRLSGK